jgi:hypothetical protein
VKRDQALVLREALDELLAFLGDRMPPALVADSVAVLLRAVAPVLAAELKAWSVAERRIRKEVTTTELFRHALCKLHIFQELNLFPGEAFRSYLDRVSALLLGAVPRDEQERFIDMVVELRGFDPREVLALAQERIPAIQAPADDAPDWAGGGDGSSAGAVGAPLDAAYQVVAVRPDRERSSQRWEEMVDTAVEHFNRGALARAVTLIEIVTGMLGEGEIDAETAERIQQRAGRGLSEDRLLEDAQASTRHQLLRKILEFFPAYSPHGLIDRLAVETDRHRRRYLLLLIQVRGLSSRKVLVDRIETTLLAPVRDNETWYLQRNLVYLLNRLPRPADADIAQEIRLVEVLTRVAMPVPLVREAVLFASSIPHPAASALLIDRIREIEKLLVDGVTDVHPVPQLWRLANGLAVALARVGTSEARLALIDHALSFHPRLGDSAARLAELARIDLAAQPEVAAALLDSLARLAPTRLLGVTMASNEGALVAIVRALAATRTPEVRRALEEVGRRFPDREFGRLASQASRAELEFAPDSEAREGDTDRAERLLHGELRVFGLPQLVQSLDQSGASGQLRLRGENRNVYAVFRFVGGKVAECVAGGLCGDDAFYQAFQYPSTGTFEFLRDDGRPVGKEKAVQPLLMEAVRRYDEFQSDRGLVGDDAFVRATGSRPTTPAEEEDGELVRVLWTRLREGATVAECELAIRKDSFRARRLLAHWVREGSVRVTTSRER